SDPVVVSIRALDPTTLEQLARAARTMIDIDRDDEATRYLTSLSQAEAEDMALYSLHQEMGSQFVIQLHTRPGIQPIGRKVAEQIMSASKRIADDPVRLQQLTEQLTSDDKYERSVALEQLQTLGERGAAAILNAFADESGVGDSKYLRSGLALMGEAAHEPVIGGIRSAVPKIQLESVIAAGNLPSSEMIVSLLRPLYGQNTSDPVKQAARQSLQKITNAIPDRAQAGEILAASVDRN
ncbi:unnamed protein product, partial [marine sediment metagenome]